MLFATLAFLLSSCTALQPVSRSGERTTDRSSTSRKAPEDSSLRSSITRYAKKYKGVKYKYAGKDPKGFDCSGFTSYVLNKFDVRVSPSSRAQAQTGRKIPFSKARAGDLVFFSKNGRGSVSHVALVVSNQREGLVVIHSTTSRGVMVQNITQSSYWKPKMLFARNVID